MVESFSNRYLISLIFNILNSFISFITSIIVIRYLTPVEYGNYQFLFSIFVAVFTFSNLNMQNGYFTFISKKKESLLFYKEYCLWEFLQLFFILMLAIIIYALDVFDLFLGLDIVLVILALTAVFFNKNIRELITNTFESQKLTSYYLKATFFINLIHLFIIAYFSYIDKLSIEIVFLFIIIEFFIYLVISVMIFIDKKDIFIDKNSSYEFKINFSRYYIYVKPLFFSSLIAFLYIFLERWLLQKYGGAEQQAYLSIAIQFSSIILILTTSVLKVLWKEIAEHLADKKMEVLEEIFLNTTKNIFLITTLISLFFIVNASDIVTIVYGQVYEKAVYVFMLINFYTIHQTLGQLYGTFLLATEETRYYSYISIFFTLISMLLIFVVLSDKFGLNLGAIGVASVMVLIQLLSVHSLGYYIKRKFKFQSMFLFQFKYLFIYGLIMFGSNFIVHSIFDNKYIIIFFEICIVGIILFLTYYKEVVKFINKGRINE